MNHDPTQSEEMYVDLGLDLEQFVLLLIGGGGGCLRQIVCVGAQQDTCLLISHLCLVD